MSHLYPGGQRNADLHRIVTEQGVRRFCLQNRRYHITRSITSIADLPHKNKREIARRLRQKEQSK